MDAKEFTRSKIYEKLDYQPEPQNYNGRIPWIVQQQIAATNGKHYANLIGRLKEYPIPDIPVPKIKQGLLLDIGSGWGRWLVSAARKGYIPIGIDIRLEFARTARSVLRDLNVSGYTVVGDLNKLPFQPNVFNIVWSFSVMQHTHKKRLLSCIQDIYSTLVTNGYCLLEFPNKNGIRNRASNVNQSSLTEDDYNSWCVRYYTPSEYEVFFKTAFDNFSYFNHSFLGIGILPSDLKYVSLKYKMLVALSLFFSLFTKVIPPLTNIADSLYVKCVKNEKKEERQSTSVQAFMKAHEKNPSDNLNILHLVKCPVTGDKLIIDSSKNELISKKAGLAYPIVDGIPILIDSEAQKI